MDHGAREVGGGIAPGISHPPQNRLPDHGAARSEEGVERQDRGPFPRLDEAVQAIRDSDFSDTEGLAALHLPIALWLAVGVAYVGGRWFARGSCRMDFVRFTGELAIYYVLIAIGGGMLVNLAWTAVLYARFLRGRGAFPALEQWQIAYLPVYSVWAAFVVVVFPPLFGFV